MVIGKGNFTYLDFKNHTITFKFKFVKIGFVNPRVCEDIKFSILRDSCGLADITVVRNAGEIIITQTFSEKRIFEQQIEDPEHFNPLIPFSLNLEAERKGLERECKICL